MSLESIYESLTPEQKVFFAPDGLKRVNKIGSAERPNIAYIESFYFYPWSDIMGLAFCVNPKYQRQGYGTELLKAYIGSFMTVNHFRCVVNPANTACIKFLEKNGFAKNWTNKDMIYYDFLK